MSDPDHPEAFLNLREMSIENSYELHVLGELSE